MSSIGTGTNAPASSSGNPGSSQAMTRMRRQHGDPGEAGPARGRLAGRALGQREADGRQPGPGPLRCPAYLGSPRCGAPPAARPGALAGHQPVVPGLGCCSARGSSASSGVTRGIWSVAAWSAGRTAFAGSPASISSTLPLASVTPADWSVAALLPVGRSPERTRPTLERDGQHERIWPLRRAGPRRPVALQGARRPGLLPTTYEISPF